MSTVASARPSTLKVGPIVRILVLASALPVKFEGRDSYSPRPVETGDPNRVNFLDPSIGRTLGFISTLDYRKIEGRK